MPTPTASRILSAALVLAAATTSPGLARAEAPASGDQYVIPLSGFPEGAVSIDECEDIDGIEVCQKIDLTLDLDGRLSGNAEVTLVGDIEGDLATFSYAGPIAGSLSGVIGDGTRAGWTRLRLRIRLAGTLHHPAVGTIASSFSMTCSARAVHGQNPGPGTCLARICARRAGCVRERLTSPLDIGAADLLDGELVIDVAAIDRNRAQGGGELIVDSQPIAALDMKGQVNTRRGFGNLVLRPSAGGRSRIQIKRAEVEQGQISKARIIYRLFGHRGRLEVAP